MDEKGKINSRFSVANVPQKAGSQGRFAICRLHDRHLKFAYHLGLCALIAMLVAILVLRSHYQDIDTAIGTHRPAELVVDVNTDRWIEFANLPSIGPKTAQAIVEHRTAEGDFETVDDLINVKGFGPKTLQRVRPFLVVLGRQNRTEQNDLPNP
jgi:competence ComEA-like helix-hairpin-helix protein